MQAFVISKLDQNNSLLVGSPKTLTCKLQSVQNAASRLILGRNRYDRRDAPLEELHWLPIQQRIQLKILLLCYKCLYCDGPEYLNELLVKYEPKRPLRSSSDDLLVEPPISKHSKTYGDRAFSVAGPKLWNKLPISVKSAKTLPTFKTRLKTHLFRIAHSLQ